MTEKKDNRLRALLVTLTATLLACLLTQTILNDITTLEVFTPLEKKVDFRLSDIYNAVAENNPRVALSQDVIVINVNDCDREGVMDIIRKVSAMRPKAIGLDIYFAVPKENNDTLYHTLSGKDSLVCAMKVEKSDSTQCYNETALSFFDETFHPLHRGFINLNVSHTWNVVRTFRPYVISDKGDTLCSMAMALAQLADPLAVERLIERNNEEEIINYTRCEIEVVKAKHIDAPWMKERLEGKVVLIGIIDDPKDIYLTPLHNPTSGVLVHAYAVQTILGGYYIKTSHTWANWLIAFIISFVFILLLRLVRLRANHLGSFILRFGQFAIMYCLVWLGCGIFSSWNIYVDFAPAILALGLAALALDVTDALYGVEKNAVLKIKTKIQKQ